MADPELGRTWLAERACYLGDGVYATFDGIHIWLRTQRDDSGAAVTHRIALEPGVFDALVQYHRELVREVNEAAKPEGAAKKAKGRK